MSNDESSESPWASSVVLGSGDTAFIRPLTVDDKPALAEFHRQQSPESIYRRYFSPKPELNDKELDHFTAVDMVDRAALVVESHDEFIAWASYERWPGRNEAEAAFMVADGRQGEGIATLLLEHLAAIARSNGIERFTAEVLGDNRAMLAVFAKAGWPLQRRFDSGVVDLDWDLATTDEFLDSVERREQRADSRAVARILIPRAVAVIGASERPGTVGDAIWRNVVDGVDAPTYAVNPRHDTIHGHPCLRSIDDLPDEVSLAIIAVPAPALDATIDACIAKRMRGAVIVTSVDGTDIDVAALVGRARRNGLRIIGPSSMGIASPRPETRLQAALVDVALPAGGVAISMQSGSLGGSLLRKARDVDLGISWFVSLGDKSDISANDLLQFWEFDDNTTVVAMYTESFGNPRKFARIARRVSRTRPIVAVRTGAAATGEMASALYQQTGLIEVPTVPALLETVRVLATQPVLQGPRVAVLTNSRSPGTLASAALSAAGLEPVAGPITLDWSASLDRVPAGHARRVGRRHDRRTHRDPRTGGRRRCGCGGTSHRRGGVGKHQARRRRAPRRGRWAGRAGITCARLHLPGAGGRRARAVVRLRPLATRRSVRTRRERAARRPRRGARDHHRGRRRGPDTGDDIHLDLATRRRLLATYGIEMAPATESTPDTAVADANEIGHPVAVKAVRRRPGRSARAGVALDLATDDDVVEAIAVMRDSLGDDANDLIVQAMTSPGVDVRIRCDHDDQLGAIVTVGLGGAQADSIDDRTSRLAPVSPASATTMLGETRLSAALDAADFDSWPLVDAVVLAAQLASDHPEIAELDLNPVIVSDDGAIVTDAVIRLVRHIVEDGPLRRLD